jgi:hypothetical protein
VQRHNFAALMEQHGQSSAKKKESQQGLADTRDGVNENLPPPSHQKRPHVMPVKIDSVGSWLNTAQLLAYVERRAFYSTESND